MAQIDVTDLVLDPDFVDAVSIIRRTTTVNTRGENVLTESAPVTAYASVQPANFKQLQRMPDDLQMSDVRAFYIKSEILQDSTSQYPDILVWQTQRYQVMTCAPWLNFGRGWNEAICVREKPS